MKTILVVGRDWKFRALLRAQLREEGYGALGFETLEEAAQALTDDTANPAAAVFDTAESATEDIQAQLSALAARLPVLVIAAAQEEFPSPTVVVLRRPVTLGEVVARVKSLAPAAP